MVHLWGERFAKEELLRCVGNMDQLACVRLSELSEGPGRGMRVVDFRTGSGFNFTLLADRCLDISFAEYRGIPLCWRSATGDVAPQFFEPEGLGWLRTFFGGVLATCGLTYAGAPCEDQGETLGLHGRIGHAPARELALDARWVDDDYLLEARGRMKEAVVFGANLELFRTIHAKLGERRLYIHDIVTNLGHQRQPLMILYHFNIGWPIVSEDSELVLPSTSVRPRDEEAEKGLEQWSRFSPPEEKFPEQCFYHELGTSPAGEVLAAIVNKKLQVGVYLRYRKTQLEFFTEWKMNERGHYVCGMEPANCEVEGRAKMRAEGKLQFINPGEERHFDIEFGVLEGADEISEARAEIVQMKV